MKSVMVSIPAREKDLCSHYIIMHSTFTVAAPLIPPSLPTNLCNLLSHKGAALKPFATSAKKAFFTFGSGKFTQSEGGKSSKNTDGDSV